jgi:hypothetical protein
LNPEVRIAIYGSVGEMISAKPRKATIAISRILKKRRDYRKSMAVNGISKFNAE